MADASSPRDVIKVGDTVEILSLPDWLLSDLPNEERLFIEGLLGMRMIVAEIDRYGYYWMGSGKYSEIDGDSVRYSGHSFCVPAECLKKIE
jgi:hypothetical protein